MCPLQISHNSLKFLQISLKPHKILLQTKKKKFRKATMWTNNIKKTISYKTIVCVLLSCLIRNKLKVV